MSRHHNKRVTATIGSALLGVTCLLTVPATPGFAESPPPLTPTNRPAQLPPLPPAPPPVERLPGGLVKIPNLVGQTEAAARQIVGSAGLTITYINYQKRGDVGDLSRFLATPPGSVLSQNPAPEQVVQPGTVVYLAVADPTESRAPIPSLQPLPAASAIPSLRPLPPNWPATSPVNPNPVGGLGPGSGSAGAPAALLAPAASAAPAVKTQPVSARLKIPGRTQFDGTPFAQGNCGAAALAMILEAEKIDRSVDSVRRLANEIQPPVAPDDGLAWETLAGVAKKFDLSTQGLYAKGSYRSWTLAELRQELAAGHPIITLVHYRSLPANQRSRSAAEHYIVLSGYDEKGFIYNDSAAYTGDGVATHISGDDLVDAWDDSFPARTALALVPAAAPTEPVLPVIAAAPPAAPAATAPDRIARDPGRQTPATGRQTEPFSPAAPTPVAWVNATQAAATRWSDRSAAPTHRPDPASGAGWSAGAAPAASAGASLSLVATLAAVLFWWRRQPAGLA